MKWVSSQPEEEKAERAAEREVENDKAEAEVEKPMPRSRRPVETDAEKVKDEAEKAKSDRTWLTEAEKAKIESDAERDRAVELAKTEAERTNKERVRALKTWIEKERLEFACQLELHKADMAHATSKDRASHPREPKLPYFNEGKAKMDTYLSGLRCSNS